MTEDQAQRSWTEDEIRAVLDHEHHGAYSYVDCFCGRSEWDADHIIDLLKEAKAGNGGKDGPV